MTYNIELGKKVFENIPKAKAPYWGYLILSILNVESDETNVITELKNLIQSNEWNSAHKQFSKIREITLQIANKKLEPYYILGEKIAKVTYNETNSAAPFDEKSGYEIYALALRYAQSTRSKEKIDQTLGILNMFEQNNLTTNFFGLLTEKSGYNLLKKIFNSSDSEMIQLKNEFPVTSILDKIKLKNVSSRIHVEAEQYPNGSFQFQFDINYQSSKIGYYALLWDNEINLIDEFLVLQ